VQDGHTALWWALETTLQPQDEKGRAVSVDVIVRILGAHGVVVEDDDQVSAVGPRWIPIQWAALICTLIIRVRHWQSLDSRSQIT
jgi:hypothetical protein